MSGKTCHDCGAKPGEMHERGCDVERCPLCGGQAIGCDCIYEELAEEYGWEHKPMLYVRTGDPVPDGYVLEAACRDGRSVCCFPNNGLPEDIYCGGPTEEMREKFEEIVEAAGGRLPWTGDWPGVAECEKFGFYCHMTPKGRVSCDKDRSGASHDLNRIYKDCVWDRQKREFVLKEKT